MTAVSITESLPAGQLATSKSSRSKAMTTRCDACRLRSRSLRQASNLGPGRRLIGGVPVGCVETDGRRLSRWQPRPVFPNAHGRRVHRLQVGSERRHRSSRQPTPPKEPRPAFTEKESKPELSFSDSLPSGGMCSERNCCIGYTRLRRYGSVDLSLRLVAHAKFRRRSDTKC
jgi:hypothetical protein